MYQDKVSKGEIVIFYLYSKSKMPSFTPNMYNFSCLFPGLESICVIIALKEFEEKNLLLL